MTAQAIATTTQSSREGERGERTIDIVVLTVIQAELDAARSALGAADWKRN